ncbi:MAG: hypothetical protein IH595_13425 [Bacteroidales bacterium]|nr:hypothetical protein [Bacteroidales bacterium]
MKSFFKDHDDHSIIKDWNGEYQQEILGIWNKEVPKHVENFNNYEEDRNAVIYFALFVEFHINKLIEILFPDFDKYLGISKTSTSMKINLLDSFRILPKQIFSSCRCINNIRNEFAHEFSITKLDELEKLSIERKNKTLEKLKQLTNDYDGDYDYEKIEDTLKNRFKSLCMNTVTAFRIYEPLIRELRKEKKEK